LRRGFRPEFLNRVDDIVLFKPLTMAEAEQIVDLQVDELRQRFSSQGFTLILTPTARSFVASSAYDPVYGARPLKRYLQHHLETRLGRAIIASEIREGSSITVDVDSGSLAVHFSSPASTAHVAE
jgi:ATP-dependent Clp protease ATP-binding subunit ClpB